MNNRSILITCLVLLLAACLLVCCAAIVGAGVYLWSSASTIESSGWEEIPALEELIPTLEKVISTPAPVEPEATESTTNPENDSDNSPAGETVSADVSRQMDEIQMQVVLDRGLKPSENVDRQLYSPDQLRQKVLDDFLEDYSAEDSQTDALTLAAFGLLEPDFDLYTFYTDLLSEQIAGFYDQKTKEMVVVQGEGFGGPERLTYAHEYTHALQDQNYDIENGLNFNDDACDADSERCAAIQALIEGDATLEEYNWFYANGTAEDQSEIMDFYNNLEMPIFDSAPEFLAMDFTFPYEYGYAFVESLYSQGGWGSVDRAYQDLPVSTEQILHPERYPDDKPIPTSLPDFAGTLGDGWEEIDRGTMGEWYTYLILAKGQDTNAQLDDTEAQTAAEGWGGDAYVVYHNADSGETVMVLQTTWDSTDEAAEFAAAFRDYATGRFGSSTSDQWQGADGYHTFDLDGDTTTWIMAPDAETAKAVWENIP
jgi:hypothetical protein